MLRILVVEDEQKLRQLFCTVLEKQGFSVIGAADGQAALDLLDREYIDLIVTDIMMPNLDGYGLVRNLREASYNMPILMITAKDTFPDKQKGFQIGVDDYMVKPIDVNEMVLRVNALLRRAQIAHERKLAVGNTKLEYDSLTLQQENEDTELPQKEFFLLFKLVANLNKIFTRQQLMNELWGMDSETDPRTVDVHVNRLRERLRTNRDIDIVTVRGLGYKAVKRE